MYYYNMMNYYHGPGTEGFWGHPFFWPFVFVGASLSFLLGLIWMILVIWMLIDLAKHDTKHNLAWALVIIFGNLIGPIGYYFIVKRERDMMKK